MVGDKYWSTGISLKWDGHGLWAAECKFLDSGFCQDESTEGVLRTRYFVDLEMAIDTLKQDVERLGIEWHDAILYGHKDGESEEYPLPVNWKEIIKNQADRIGFGFPYLLEEVSNNGNQRID